MKPLLDVRNLVITTINEKEEINIINNVSFTLEKGRTLGVVGESGCGKSITSLSVMGLLPSALNFKSGSIKLSGKELTTLSKKERRKLRGKEMAIVFQEPMTSLNPVYTIGYQIIELIRNHEKISKKEAYARALQMLELVGIPRPNEVINEYPHQLSGGMRQRVMIAIALSCNPKLLIADEPTTALDVTIQAQILDLMKLLQDQMQMSIILVTHDLGVVAEMCDEVIIMYAGEVVERTTVDELFENPKHPYTKGLLASIPDLDKETEMLSSIPGTVPSPKNMPIGCRFADRCPFAVEKCFIESPSEFSVNGHSSTKCWLYENKEEQATMEKGGV